MNEQLEIHETLQSFLTPETLPVYSRDRWLVPPSTSLLSENERETLRSLQIWKPQSLNVNLEPVRDPITGQVRGFEEKPEESSSHQQIELLSRRTSNETNDNNENEEDAESDQVISDLLLTAPPGLEEGVQYPRGSHRFIDFPSLSDSDPVNTQSVLDRLAFSLPDTRKPETSSLESEDGLSNEYESEEELQIGVIKSSTESCPRPGQEKSVLHLKQPAILPKAKSWAFAVDTRNTPVTEFDILVPKPARIWPFELDTFQKQAVIYLEKHRDVFVSAHTSAGKTVVAEYAIALSKRHDKRTIYTSPIKALSNQKFREFKDHFEDVGLITGDVQINPSGSCIIMTTEILRSMLYNRSAIIWELDWVIFDECHYINDADRGVVWEEVIIMLPPHISVILLSATIANPLDFAEWVGRIKQRPIYVISTSHRPVPLEHFLFTGNSNRTVDFLFKIVDEQRSFSMQAYTRAVDSTKPSNATQCTPAARAAALAATQAGWGGDRGRGGRGGARGQQHHHQKQQIRVPTPGSGGGSGDAAEKTFWLAVIQMLRSDERLPAVVFVFSKTRIDQVSSLLRSADLLTKAEQNTVHTFIQSCVKRLKPQDRRIPQLRSLQELLSRGIGIHHSGILPFLREVVELLFQQSLVKVLFATETFAMGVNMPARTVLFDSIRKFDGRSRRALLPGEYTQMAGRAGRRGLDEVGSVMVLCRNREVPPMGDLQRMMLGKPTPLESHFRLTYAMILSLLRHEARVFDMMRQSFGEFGDQVSLERRKLRRQELAERLHRWPSSDCQQCAVDLERYARLGINLAKLRESSWKEMVGHPGFARLVTPGRVVGLSKRRVGVVLHGDSRRVKVLSLSPAPQPVSRGEEGNLLAAELLLPSGFRLTEPGEDEEETPVLIEIDFSEVAFVCEVVIKLNNRAVSEMIEDISKRRMARLKKDPYAPATKWALSELKRQLTSNDSVLAYVKPQKFEFVAGNKELLEDLQTMEVIESELALGRFICVSCHELEEHMKVMQEKIVLEDELKELQHDLSGTVERLQLLPEYHQRLDVLRALAFVDPRGHVRLKGRMACTISSHELVITEMVLTGQLEDLVPAEIAALFSAFVFEHRRLNEDVEVDARNKSLPTALKAAQKELIAVAERVGTVQKQCGMTESVEDFVNRLNFDLTAVVLDWARGVPFKDIAEMTEVQEGIIVRTVVRLDELLRNVADAAHVLGNPRLQEKMKTASQIIKRDIIFAASLYTD